MIATYLTSSLVPIVLGKCFASAGYDRHQLSCYASCPSCPISKYRLDSSQRYMRTLFRLLCHFAQKCSYHTFISTCGSIRFASARYCFKCRLQVCLERLSRGTDGNEIFHVCSFNIGTSLTPLDSSTARDALSHR